MVSQGGTQDQDQEVIQEDLLQLYVQINQRMIVLHVELYTKLGSALHHLLFVLNVTNKTIMPNSAILPQVCQLPIEIQGHLGMAEIEAVEARDPNMLRMKLKQLMLQNLLLM